VNTHVRPLSPPPHILPDPQKGAPLTELPHRKMVPFWNPPNLLKFPVNKHPRFPNGSLRREASVSRAFFYTFPSKSLVNETPSMFPNRVPMEREASSPEPMVYSFIHSLIYMSESPVKSPPTKMGENIWSPSTEPHMDGRPTYSGVRPGSPRGSFLTLQSLPQCQAAYVSNRDENNNYVVHELVHNAMKCHF